MAPPTLASARMWLYARPRLIRAVRMALKPYIVTIAAIIIVVLIVLRVGFGYIGTVFTHKAGYNIAEFSSDTEGVILVADLFNVDVPNQMFSVRWSVLGGCGSSFTINHTNGCSLNSLSIPINLYLDKNASTPYNASDPILQYDPDDITIPAAMRYYPGRETLPPAIWTNMMVVDPYLPYTLYKRQSGLDYPFDQLNAYASVLVVNPNNSATVPVVTVVGYGTTVNWISECEFGTAPALPGSSIPQYYVMIWAIRQRLVKGIAVVLVLTTWLLSLAILYMTILVIFGRKVDTQLILASTTVLFALPQIRSSMPDSPPLGTGAYIDTGGYFISLSLVSACTSLLLIVSLIPYEKRPGAKIKLPDNESGSPDEGNIETPSPHMKEMSGRSYFKVPHDDTTISSDTYHASMDSRRTTL
ncbi:hypothetical protein BD410DRAFT_837478 [Rickenella mellea]|uniref:Uncharacterized protein n=1 Tax=Rickenella mellea TaxID=50990 RepID=A0A4Y7QC48_9AGAM|nr:hypothetical protein BD410DRAFT_837478 [Rickenella mellea]